MRSDPPPGSILADLPVAPSPRAAVIPGSPPITAAEQGHQRVLLAFALAAAAILVYANSLGSGFALDDGSIIFANERVHQLSRMRDIWLTPYWPQFGRELGLYRPMAIFLYALQWAVGGGEPWVFHTVNVLLHAVVTVLVFVLLARLAGGLPAAVGALLFAVHPVHTEAVANVVGQAELVTASAVLAAALVHATRPVGVAVGWGRRLALVALFAIGVFTKENAVILPGLLVLIDLAQHRVELSRRGLLRYADALAMPLLLMAAVLGLYAVLRFGALEGAFLGVDSGPQLAYLKEHRLLNALRAFPELMRLLFFPAQLSADYHPAVVLPVQSLTPMTGLGLGLLAGLVLLALLTPWQPRIGFPAAWFLVSSLVVSNLLFPIGVLIAERTLYLPSIALAALAAFAWPALGRRVPRGPLLSALAVICLAFGIRTWQRNPDWASTSAVLTSVVRDRPESYRAQWSLGATYLSRGDVPRAALHFEAAYRIYPRDSEFLDEYANFLLSHGEPARALQMLEPAYRMHPYVLRSASLLAYAYLANGRYREALTMISRVESLDGPLGATMPLRAYAFEQTGDLQRAVAAWRVTIRQPGLGIARNWSYLARALALAGYRAEAAAAARQARAVAADAPARAQAKALEVALSNGCYGPASDSRLRTNALAASPDPGRLACDPLGDWLQAVAPQSAKGLQNAKAGSGTGLRPPT